LYSPLSNSTPVSTPPISSLPISTLTVTTSKRKSSITLFYTPDRPSPNDHQQPNTRKAESQSVNNPPSPKISSPGTSLTNK